MSLPSSFHATVDYRDDEDCRRKLRKQLGAARLVHLRGVRPDRDLHAFYAQLTSGLGALIRRGEDLASQKFVADQWLDVRYDPGQAATFRHSNTRQPLHTDGAYITAFPCELVFLFCEQEAECGGETVFVDGEWLWTTLSQEAPELLAALAAQPVTFAKGDMGQRTAHVIRREGGGVYLNWNHFRLAPQNPPATRALAGQFHAYLEEQIVARQRFLPLKLKRGEAVFFHDRRVLHGRTAFQGDRCLIKGALTLSEAEITCW